MLVGSKLEEFIFQGNWKDLLVRAPRRTGKTTLLTLMAIQEVLNGKEVVIVCPTYDHVADFKNRLPKFATERLHIVSADSGPMRGSVPDLLLMDNAAQISHDVAAALLPMTFGHPHVRRAAFSTWYPGSWFSEEWNRERSLWYKIWLPGESDSAG